MSKPQENFNYMDQFETPEEFIFSEIIANRGSNNIVDKAVLVEVLGWSSDDAQLHRLSKAELFDRIVKKYGDKAYTMFPIGVSSISFQKKFSITHKEVMKLAKAGFLTVTGERKFRKFGKYLYAKVFSPFEYFRLTQEEIRKYLNSLT